MTRTLYEEYFGGEILDTNNQKNSRLLNRWQYAVLTELMEGDCDCNHIGNDSLNKHIGHADAAQIRSITSEIKSITPEILERRLNTKRINLTLEDNGSIKMNALAPSQYDIDTFIQTIIQSQNDAGVLDNLFIPRFDRKYYIRKDVTFPKLSGPRMAILELTPSCYLSCITCYNELARGQGKKSFNTEELISTIDQLSGLGVHTIALSGGETTAAKGWYDIAKHAKDKEIKLRFYTCGIYPDSKRDEVIRQIHEINCDEIRITYAGTKYTNDNVRIRKDFYRGTIGTFDDITRTVEDLLQSKDKVKLNYTLAHENKTEVKEFLEFVYALSEKHGVMVPVNIGPLRVYGGAAIPNRFPFTKPTAIDFFEVHKIVSDFRKRLKMDISTVFDCIDNFGDDEYVKRIEKISAIPWPFLHQGCGLGRSGMGIGYDGSVQVCGIFSDSLKENVIKIIKENPELYAQYGITKEKLIAENLNSKEVPLENIWYDSALFSYFQFFYKKEQCEPCNKYRVQCMGICPGMAMYDSGDIRKGDTGCPVDISCKR